MSVIRSLARRPAYALMSTGLLALGVGAVGAIAAVADVALLRPLPYADPARLYSLQETEPVRGDSTAAHPLTPPQFARWRADSKAFSGIEGALPRSMLFAGKSETEAIAGMQASAGLFTLLGVAPSMGRSFTRDEEAPGSGVAIVSHDFWLERLAADPAVLGRSLTLDGEARTIVGVMPPGFSRGVREDRRVDPDAARRVADEEHVPRHDHHRPAGTVTRR